MITHWILLGLLGREDATAPVVILIEVTGVWRAPVVAAAWRAPEIDGHWAAPEIDGHWAAPEIDGLWRDAA